MGSQYSPVVLNNPRGGAEGENHGIYGRVKGVGWSVLPFVSSVLYLADVVSSICYAVVLFVHADDRDVVNRQLNFRLWGACIIVEHVLSGIFINGIATFYRNDMKTMNNKTKAVEIVKCFFIPEYHVLLALYRHIESTVSGSVSVNAVEWAAFTRLLQAMVEAIPQAIIQSYFFFVDFMPKDTEFASSIPVASMCLSMFNAAFGYTFFVVYKYYDQMREYPPFWQCLLVALASLFILGGRTISVSLMGYAYMPWLAFLCLVIIYLLLFVSWTYRVWKRDGDPQKNIMIRAAYSIIETFAVTVSLKKMVLTSLCFMGLCVAYVIQNNNELVMWIMFCVPIVVQILGLILVLPCRYIYEQAYKVLVLSILPSKQVIDEDIEN